VKAGFCFSIPIIPAVCLADAIRQSMQVGKREQPFHPQYLAAWVNYNPLHHDCFSATPTPHLTIANRGSASAVGLQFQLVKIGEDM
jgi:hypothetical protein